MTTLLKTLLQKVKTVLKLKKKRLTMAVFREKQREKYGSDVVSLIIPAPTRFAGAYLTFKFLQEKKRALQETSQKIWISQVICVLISQMMQDFGQI